VLGQEITISQDGASDGVGTTNAPTISSASMPTNGVFQFSFTNGTHGATYSVLFTTNLATPITNWSLIGTASEVTPDLWQFTDSSATNLARFYMIRSP